MKYNINDILKTKKSLGAYRFSIVAIPKTGWRTIEFMDHKHTVNAHISAIKRGEIKNPFHPSVLRVGCLGVGEAKVSIGGKLTPAYKEWIAMLKRVYTPTEKSGSYKDVSICADWHNFNTFYKWHILNYSEGCELDKDILQYNTSMKTYSPLTCLYIPHSINTYVRRLKSTNTSGCSNVSFNKSRNTWIVRHTDFYTRKREYLKSFINKGDAIEYSKKIAQEDYLTVLKNINNE